MAPARYSAVSRLSTFLERRKHGVGRFFTRDEIERASPSSIGSLLRRVPGVRVREGQGELAVTFAQCQNAVIPSGKNDASAGFGVLALYVDGTRVQPREDIPSVLGSLRPSDIEAVEVNRGPSEVPIEALGDAGAAIYIWTRLGG